jgi:V8-like Glu-specific endopeptidase
LGARLGAASDGWYRCTVTVLSDTSKVVAAYVSLDGGIGSDPDTSIYAGTGSSGAYLYGAQLVGGIVPGVYDATTDTSNNTAVVPRSHPACHRRRLIPTQLGVGLRATITPALLGARLGAASDGWYRCTVTVLSDTSTVVAAYVSLDGGIGSDPDTQTVRWSALMNL